MVQLGAMSVKQKLHVHFVKNVVHRVFSRIESAPGVVAIKTGVLDEQPSSKPNLAMLD